MPEPPAKIAPKMGFLTAVRGIFVGLLSVGFGCVAFVGCLMAAVTGMVALVAFFEFLWGELTGDAKQKHQQFEVNAMLFERGLFAALSSHNWTTDPDETQHCSTCGLRYPARNWQGSVEVQSIPLCPGAPSDADDDEHAAPAQPTDQ